MLSTSAFSAIGLFAASATAHGAVTSYVIAGKTYPGYQGFAPAHSPSVIQWQWPDYSPIMSCSVSNIRCNGGKSAMLNAPVAPGDSVQAIWQQWTHSLGPILVWMYKCPGDFAACDGSGTGWFKIDEAGFHGNGSKVFLDTEAGSGWDIAKLVGGNKGWTSKIPAELAPGNYLIRHELIALHQANSPQFYPECAQLTVTGNGTAQPVAEQKVEIPGYCNDTDPNIKVNINDHFVPQTYRIPGPAVFVGSGPERKRGISKFKKKYGQDMGA